MKYILTAIIFSLPVISLKGVLPQLPDDPEDLRAAAQSHREKADRLETAAQELEQKQARISRKE